MQERIDEIFKTRTITTILNSIFDIALNTILTMGGGAVGWTINAVLSGL